MPNTFDRWGSVTGEAAEIRVPADLAGRRVRLARVLCACVWVVALLLAALVAVMSPLWTQPKWDGGLLAAVFAAMCLPFFGLGIFFATFRPRTIGELGSAVALCVAPTVLGLPPLLLGFILAISYQRTVPFTVMLVVCVAWWATVWPRRRRWERLVSALG
jgi:hypothetical protein